MARFNSFICIIVFTIYSISDEKPGILAFSRILNDKEVVIIANPSGTESISGSVIVDFALNPPYTQMNTLYSNRGNSNTPAGMVTEKPQNSVIINELNNSVTNGPARVLPFNLQPMEIQIINQLI